MNDSDDRYIDEDYEEAFDYGDFDVTEDGDHESALASAGWGTDEDYGYADEVY